MMLDIIYQDNDLIAVNKPSGWLVHRSWLDPHETVFVMQTLRDQIGQHVFPVHRLDRPTSGVLLFALSSEVAHQLSLQFEQQQTEKVYHALVRGYITESGVIDYPLKEKLDKIADKFAEKEKPAQSAITDYQPLLHLELPIAVGRYETARYTFVELRPKTGRKHQLRRHMRHLRHPIIGDTAYGDLKQNRAFQNETQLHRLMLHASSLQITHPVTKQSLQIEAKLDESWQELLSKKDYISPSPK